MKVIEPVVLKGDNTENITNNKAVKAIEPVVSKGKITENITNNMP